MTSNTKLSLSTILPLLQLLLLLLGSELVFLAAGIETPVIQLPSTELFFKNCFSRAVNYSADDVVYTPDTKGYAEILLSSINNNVFIDSSSKPLILVVPTDDSHVQATVVCGRSLGILLRVRSGGHDYEGLSYRSALKFGGPPFILLDLNRLRSISVDSDGNEAWVDSGTTLGEMYYILAKTKPNRAFPAGFFKTVGVGGHLSGGGIGALWRMYGLASDNIIDCRLVDVEGRILDRKSMGEDLFWAVRGSGGASFGVILSFKIKLVEIPDSVTVCYPDRSKDPLELIHRWQYVAYKLPKELFISVIVSTSGSGIVGVKFRCFFLGGQEKFLQIVGSEFPELDVEKDECLAMSWSESLLYHPSDEVYVSRELEELLDRTPQLDVSFKGKYDFVTEPIPMEGLKKMWSKLRSTQEAVHMELDPSGGVMHEIAESETPYPHRAGVIYKILYMAYWRGTSRKSDNWTRSFYENVMTPYVSSNPRCAYINVKDLDLGMNKMVCGTGVEAFEESRVWGEKYFKGNYERLAIVKGKVDPENYFWNEQSIPPLVLA